jgi:hypothetical protein
MTRHLRIKLNLKALTAHLSREEGQILSNDQVVIWLKEAGFRRSGNYWLVSQADLGHLDPSEVLEVEVADERG